MKHEYQIRYTKSRGVAIVYFNVPAIDKLGKHIAEGVRLLSLPKKVQTNDSLLWQWQI